MNTTTEQLIARRENLLLLLGAILLAGAVGFSLASYPILAFVSFALSLYMLYATLAARSKILEEIENKKAD